MEFKIELEQYFEEEHCSVDVVVLGKNGERLIAVEIALSNKLDYEVHNIEKCLKLGFQKVISTSVSETKLKGVRKYALNKIQDLSKVEFRLIKDFYKGVKP